MVGIKELNEICSFYTYVYKKVLTWVSFFCKIGEKQKYQLKVFDSSIIIDSTNKDKVTTV